MLGTGKWALISATNANDVVAILLLAILVLCTKYAVREKNSHQPLVRLLFCCTAEVKQVMLEFYDLTKFFL